MNRFQLLHKKTLSRQAPGFSILLSRDNGYASFYIVKVRKTKGAFQIITILKINPMIWNNAEVNDKLHEYFEVRNGKLLVTIPGLNRLLMDPRCPSAKQSNMVEYMQLIKKQLELRLGNSQRKNS